MTLKNTKKVLITKSGTGTSLKDGEKYLKK